MKKQMGFSKHAKSALSALGLLICLAGTSFAVPVTLEWDANPEPDLAGYKLHYKTGMAGGEPYDGSGALYEGVQRNSPIDVGNVTEVQLDVPEGHVYYFVVIAYDNEDPPLESDFSNEVSFDAVTGGQTWTVAFSAGANGTLSGTASQTVADGGSSSAVSALADPNYHFVNWTGSGFSTSTANPLILTNVQADLSITANFAVNTHLVTFTAGANGRVSEGVTSQVVPHGGTCSAVTVEADPYYVFVGWGNDYPGNENPLTLADVVQDMTLTAVFERADDDLDGISTIEEMGPGGDDAAYDGNDDGIPDAQQDDAASFYTVNSTGGSIYVTLAVAAGDDAVNMNINRMPADPVSEGGTPSHAGESVEFPYGFYEFTLTCIGCPAIPGGFTPDVTLYLPEGASPNIYYKFGPTPENRDDHWYAFMYDDGLGVGAEIQSNVVVLYFVDGQKGDDDLEDDNGVVVDIGGPGVN